MRPKLLQKTHVEFGVWQVCMLTVQRFGRYDGLKLTELILMEISSIKHSGDQQLIFSFLLFFR